MKKKIALLAALIFMLGTVQAQALNLMDLHNSPLKSLLALQKAAKKHDVEAFEKYVSLDSFISRVYDDGIAAVSESGNSKLITYTAMTGIYRLVKPLVVPYAKRCVLERIAGDNTEQKIQEQEGTAHRDSIKEKTLETADRLLDMAEDGAKELIEKLNPANLLKETIDFDHSEIKKVATHKKDKNEAIVAVTIYNTELEQNFVLRLKLEALGKRGWRVIEPVDFKDYVLALDRAKKTK
ncbi:MAG: hypothetical protein Q4E34_04080 [Synergistaceae bacterium]|nr:hypothetical protein [Synergistaceae bacterium]